MPNVQKLLKRLQNKEVIIVDGATGTEIRRRGVNTGLPLWSAWALIHSPRTVVDIHRDYVLSGSEIIKTNTFRTNYRTITKAGLSKDDDKKLTQLACDCARQAVVESRTSKEIFIAGSQAPLEDCYSPHLVPDVKTCLKEHRRYSQSLATAGVDFIWLETFNTIRETVIALQAVKETKLQVAVSFVCTKEGRLLSGEDLKTAVRAVEKFPPLFITINCMPPHHITQTLPMLRSATKLPHGAYGNGAGHPDNKEGWLFEGSDPIAGYVQHVQKWVQQGAQIIGGCCGTNPEYIKKISLTLAEYNQ